MISFICDYSNGVHPKILEEMANTNDLKTVGYGEDEICLSAKEKIRKVIKKKDADIGDAVEDAWKDETKK